MHLYYNLILQKFFYMFLPIKVHHQEVRCTIQALWCNVILQLNMSAKTTNSKLHIDLNDIKSYHNSFIDTNLIHNFYINYIKLSSSTCFERHPLIISLPLASAQDGHLQRMRIPEVAYMYS